MANLSKNRNSVEITELLAAWQSGDHQAAEHLINGVYHQLHCLASRGLKKEKFQHTLCPTALVSETYERLANQKKVPWKDRDHFFSLAARIMRNILVDRIRKARRKKRLDHNCRTHNDEIHALESPRFIELVHEALEELHHRDPRLSRVVELRFFCGLSIEETAEILRVSPSTVNNYWYLARAWLYGNIKKGRRI